jgi:tryptophan synthase beta subunit
MFHPFVEDKSVKLLGVEAGGEVGLKSNEHCAPLTAGAAVGVLHGTKTYLMQSKDGQIAETHSISAGLDYPGVAPSTPSSRMQEGQSTRLRRTLRLSKLSRPWRERRGSFLLSSPRMQLQPS